MLSSGRGEPGGLGLVFVLFVVAVLAGMLHTSIAGVIGLLLFVGFLRAIVRR